MKQYNLFFITITSSSSSSSPTLFQFTFFLLFFNNVIFLITTTDALVKLPPNVTVPAVIAFGDSIVDAGNNNDLVTPAKSNFPPYGVDFYGGVPTGRFSDGKVPPDLTAEELGIKSLVPAYRDPHLTPQDLLTGVTFASGGCGYDPQTTKLAAAISLWDQLKYFEEYKEKVKALVGEERRDFIVEKSLFIVVVGSNDIANTYFGLSQRRLQYDVVSYTSLIADSASNFARELYEYGARRVGVFGIPPIGCIPSQRTLAGGLVRGCAENYNDAAKLFNAKLSMNLDSLSRTLPGSILVYVDIYNPLLDLIRNFRSYGFEVADRGCCGTGKIEAAVFCNSQTSSICSNVSAHVFWDGYHPTERAYRILVSQVLHKLLQKIL